MTEMKKRMKFDSDGDKNINFDEVNFISICTITAI